MLLRFDPFRELDRRTESATGRRSAMPMDAYRDGDRYRVQFDLPGVDPASIDVTVDKNALTVQAERQWQAGAEVAVVANERPHGSFTRQLYLGDSLDAEHIEAHYEHGVLTLTIPVAEAAKPRKIEVSASPSGDAIETSSRAA